MKLPLLVLTILLLSINSWSLVGQVEYYDDYEVIMEDTLEPILWCREATMPVWIGCDNDSIVDLNNCTELNILDFIQKNVKIPEGLGRFQGKVFISFVIDKNGEVTDVELLKGLHKKLDAAAIEVVKMLPKFTPATQREKPCAVKYNVPVSFKLY